MPKIYKILIQKNPYQSKKKILKSKIILEKISASEGKTRSTIYLEHASHKKLKIIL